MIMIIHLLSDVSRSAEEIHREHVTEYRELFDNVNQSRMSTKQDVSLKTSTPQFLR